MDLKRILFTDDDPDIRHLVQICLENSDFIVEICESGSETLKKIPLFKPDLIILDVLMPHMDGINTYKMMKQNNDFASIPVVFMTAHNSQKEIDALLKLGAADVIIKPFQPFSFADNLKEIWNNKNNK